MRGGGGRVRDLVAICVPVCVYTNATVFMALHVHDMHFIYSLSIQVSAGRLIG